MVREIHNLLRVASVAVCLIFVSACATTDTKPYTPNPQPSYVVVYDEAGVPSKTYKVKAGTLTVDQSTDKVTFFNEYTNETVTLDTSYRFLK